MQNSRVEEKYVCFIHAVRTADGAKNVRKSRPVQFVGSDDGETLLVCVAIVRFFRANGHQIFVHNDRERED